MKCYQKDYPRPQFVRKNWENLNGSWDFAFDDADVGEKERWYETFRGQRTIQVPFTYETALSGIGDEKNHNFVWYRRMIQADGEKLKENRYLLHFEGSDFLTKVWVNGSYAGSHRGGYARFTFDITDLLTDGENELVVRAEDSFDMQQPRGKQRWRKESYACWYVQTTGIWKTVWAEYVPKLHLNSVKMTPNLDTSALELEYEVDAPFECLGEDLAVEAVVTFDGQFQNKIVTSVISRHMETQICVFSENGISEGGVKYWTPASPDLYDIEFRVVYKGQVEDTVGSYFAMRDIRIDGPTILLNGYPLYQRLILDQGYWKDSHLTPPGEEALIEDIDKIHALGFNGLRKHQKIEDERFLYWCDVKGMLVWSEAPAAYQFTDYAVAEFTTEWMEIVKQNYNHPCIITWTPFNESWGIGRVKGNRTQQHFTETIYHLTKSLDRYRPVIVNDGWEHTVSDIITLHDYEEDGLVLTERYRDKERITGNELYHNLLKSAMADGFSYQGQPVIISEYGGIAFCQEGGWGYGEMVKSRESFLSRYDQITTAIKELPYVCGYCYTQVSDVQQEVNGLMDEERNFKVDPEAIREINERKTGLRFCK